MSRGLWGLAVLAVLGCGSSSECAEDSSAAPRYAATRDAAAPGAALQDAAPHALPPIADGPSQSDSVVCSQPVCGDGRAAEPCGPAREACDGEDLRGLSCEALGLAGGALACGTDCALDLSACTPCTDDARIHACARLPTKAGHSHGLGLAVRDGVVLVATAINDVDAIGMAFVDGGVQSEYLHPLRLIALDTELRPLSAPRELPSQEAWVVGLVSVSDGFLLVYAEGWVDQAMLIAQHLDATGAPDADPVTLSRGQGGVLIAQPGGGPLLVANSGGAQSELRAILLDEHGREQLAADVSGDYVGAETSGAFTGDGFLLPVVTVAGGQVYSMRHVGLDGTVTSGFTLPFGMNGDSGIHYAQTVADGAAASIVWSDTGADELVCPDPPPPDTPDATAGVVCESIASPLRWARLDTDGELLDGPRDLGVPRALAVPLHDSQGHLLVSGVRDTSSEGVTTGVVVRRLDADMELVGEPVSIVAEAQVETLRAVTDADGSVFVVYAQHAWEPSLGWLAVARVAPP